MKTLEEACLATFARVEPRKPGDDDDAQTRRMFEAIVEDTRRWAQTADEIRSCDLVLAYVMAVSQVAVTPTWGLMSCFIQGVIVGIEMQRTELLIAPESVPGRREKGQLG